MTQARFVFLPRDHEVLVALARGPLVAEQLLRLSTTFSRPFRDIRRTRERLSDLARAGLVCRWPVASEAGSGRTWYTLDNGAMPLLFGDERRRVRPRRPLSLARARHTYHLSEFIVHTLISTHQNGGLITGFSPEGSVRLTIGEETVIPDSSFILEIGGRTLHYFIEMDEATERLKSDRSEENWQRKIRLYEAFQDLSKEKRFRLLVATTGGPLRVKNILDLAKSQARNPERTLVLAATLPSFLESRNPLTDAVFADHKGQPASVVPASIVTALGQQVESKPSVRHHHPEEAIAFSSIPPLPQGLPLR